LIPFGCDADCRKFAPDPQHRAGTTVDFDHSMAKPRKRQDGDPSFSEPSAASGSGNGNGHGGSPDSDRISMRAYELYLARGGGDGQAVEDWLTAERELNTRGESATRSDRGE
jgi:hypothetical protein